MPDNLKSAKFAPAKPHRGTNAVNRLTESPSLGTHTLWERAMGDFSCQQLETSRVPGMSRLTPRTTEFTRAIQRRQEMFKQNTASNRFADSLLASYQSPLDMLKLDTASNRFADSLFASYQSPLDMLKPLLLRLSQLSQCLTTSPLRDITQQLAASQRLMANIGVDEIGSHYKTITGLKSSMDHVAPTYESLAESLLREVSDITRLPTSVLPEIAGETSTPSFEFETLRPHDERDEEDTETKIQLVTATEQETSGCIALLKQVDPRLVRPYIGAWSALRGNNPDKTRHVLISLRELCGNLIRLLAPSKLVLSWIPEVANQKNLLDRGKPTRLAREMYIRRELNNGSLTEFLLHDTRAELKLFDLFNRVHELEIDLTYKQLRAILLRVDSWLMYILKISAKNSHN